ncbi:MAG: potassium-transporting ATPase KdpC subunit [Actinomycetota bacterium]|nr:potassium-transporting ATPase KdpC subunit [Actinomycetota bacterium]
MAMSFLRQSGAAIRLLVIATLVLGVAYPAAGLLVGQAFPRASAGSLLEVDGQVVGSRLIGQAVEGDQWFHPRPSAADYDAMRSGGSNLGPNNPELVGQIAQRQAQVAAREGVELAQVPPDAVTASGSGLDPGISPAYARLQVARVARTTGVPTALLLELIDEATTRPALGVLGAPSVNVVLLNASLARTIGP